ncbi:MAG TPA: TIGR04283 family arsenosugar biosynthesis glycosyltransferase [Dissulfurispiraceae bacterium]|nr:TIGR04283 family arsenosugar biosynthesis glycosyltransferase [Dissulfurispiraceae bacterium]
MQGTISIIVPVLNEEKILSATLSSLSLSDREELIVVDGGSTDETAAIASQFTDKVFTTLKGRGRQMNFGGLRAEGDILLFLHADCSLPPGGFATIRETLRTPGTAAGAFDIRFTDRRPSLKITGFAANLRSRVTGIPYGDQGLFMTKAIFDKLGGFADIPLMEDIEISRRLKRAGKIVFVRPPISVSPRRLLNEGLVYAIARDWTIALSFAFLNTSPERLIKHYKDIR